MAVSIPKFLSYLTSSWERDIPLKNLWVIYFDDLSRVARSVSNILYNTENFFSNTRWPVVDYGYDQDYQQGLFVAQSVVMPNDSFAIDLQENTNMGGLRSGYIGSQRNPYREINIEFLETNIDIVDHLFRPWIIASSHKGLIEDNDFNTDIKCNLYVSLFSRINNYRPNSGVPEWTERKTFRFEGVVPNNVEGDRLKYTAMDSSDIVKSVSFAFKHYYLLTNYSIQTVLGQDLTTYNQSRNLASNPPGVAPISIEIPKTMDSSSTTTPSTTPSIEIPEGTQQFTGTPTIQVSESINLGEQVNGDIITSGAETTGTFTTNNAVGSLGNFERNLVENYGTASLSQLNQTGVVLNEEQLLKYTTDNYIPQSINLGNISVDTLNVSNPTNTQGVSVGGVFIANPTGR